MTDAQPPHPPAGAGRDLVGTVLAGRYRIIEKLGEGAMGAIYVGEHLKIGRKDAIKVLNDSLATDREAALRFMRGARNVSAIRHPNVCTIYDFSDTADGLQFMAMELVPGETLRDLLDREGRLPFERASSIAAQAADALEAAHEAGIVHRDLKPANIMVAPGKAGADVVKVVDFDIAKGSKEGAGAEVTRLGFVVGTPEYMSPEQLIGESLDGRSDVYSLALVLFRMLAGAMPFRSSGTQDMMLERLTELPLRLDEVAPGAWPPALQAVLDRALQRRAEDRTPSAAGFAAEIRAAAAGSDAVMTGGVRGPGITATTVGRSVTAPPRPGTRDLPPTTVAEAGTASGRGAKRPREPGGNGRKLALIGGGAALLAAVFIGGAVLLDGDAPDPGTSGQIDPDRLGVDPVGGAGGSDAASGGATDAGTGPAGTGTLPVDQGGGRTAGTTGMDPAGGSDDSGRGGNVADDGGGDSAGGDQAARDQQATQADTRIVVTPAGANDRLIALLSGMSRETPRVTLIALRDTSRAYYDLGAALSPADRAQAAYNVALAYSILEEVGLKREWAQRALDLNPAHRAARVLLGGGTRP